MMNYDTRQLSTVSRYHSNITCHRILKIEDNRLYFNRLKGDKTVVDSIAVSRAAAYHVNDWIDLQIESRYVSGKESSCRIRMIGRTPEEFIPVNQD